MGQQQEKRNKTAPRSAGQRKNKIGAWWMQRHQQNEARTLVRGVKRNYWPREEAIRVAQAHEKACAACREYGLADLVRRELNKLPEEKVTQARKAEKVAKKAATATA